MPNIPNEIIQRPKCQYCKEKDGIIFLFNKIACGDCTLKWHKKYNEMGAKMVIES